MNNLADLLARAILAIFLVSVVIASHELATRFEDIVKPPAQIAQPAVAGAGLATDAAART